MKKIIILIISIFFGLSIAWADDVIKNACPDGVKPNKTLAISDKKTCQTTLSNEKDKCYKVNHAKFAYLIDKKHAVYSVYIDSSCIYQPQLFLFEYINSEVQWRTIGGVIKGTGEVFNYKDNQGVSRTMPRVIVIKDYQVQRVF